MPGSGNRVTKKKRTPSKGNAITKTVNSNNKCKLNLQIRSLTRTASHSSSTLEEMIEHLQNATREINNELENQNNNPSVQHVLIEEQELPDNLSENSAEQDGKEKLLMRIGQVESQIKTLMAEYAAEKEIRLKLSAEVEERHKSFTERIAYLEKLQENNQNNKSNIDEISNALLHFNSQQITEPDNSHDLISLNPNNSSISTNGSLPQMEKVTNGNDSSLSTNTSVPHLQKATNNNEMEVEFVDEILRDYKFGMPKLKKEFDTTEQVNEWPILTLEQDYSEKEVCSTHNSHSRVQIKKEIQESGPSTSKY